jgi:hypothetical protein
MNHEPIKHYIVLKATPEGRNAYSAGIDAVLKYVADWIFRGVPMIDLPIAVTSLPSNEIGAALAALGSKAGGAEAAAERKAEPAIGDLDGLVVALNVRSEKTVTQIEQAVEKIQDIFSGSSPDLPFATTDHWCPRDAIDPIFADRSAAERLLGVDYLQRQDGTTGRNVNVVIVDQGLDASVLGGNYIAGWPVGTKLPGTTKSPEPGTARRTHGMMIAHNILKVAPDVGFFDLPLAPVKISDIPVYLSLADAAYRTMLTAIANYRKPGGGRPGPWILVNPWGIFDTRTDPRGRYTKNPNNPLNRLVVGAVGQEIDVVFAAGNCGQFCPDNRCGALDQGPGHSIWGANSLKQVLTVGAVRSDTMWLGYSSQGPGQPRLGKDKPDLCAPSQFCETDDAFTVNTGTSAACAMAAGVVTALRSRWDCGRVPPAQLIEILRDTVRKPNVAYSKERFGQGILDAKAAFDELKVRYP